MRGEFEHTRVLRWFGRCDYMREIRSSHLQPLEPSGSDHRGLSVSVVVYHPQVPLLAQTLSSLGSACDRLRKVEGIPLQLFVVDNGGFSQATIAVELGRLRERGVTCSVISGHGNVGYGRGHNLAIERTGSRYHLVLNPDIDMNANALMHAFRFLENHPDAGLVTPRIDDESGAQQYLCRRYPTVLDLFVRGFVPRGVQRYFAARLDRYEMRDVINPHDILWDPPIATGCFMFFRTAALKRLGGFDSRYFVYFEDYDLSLRTHELTRVVYVPSVRAVHHGGGAALKGLAHIRMFMASALKFYNRFGWKWR